MTNISIASGDASTDSSMTLLLDTHTALWLTEGSSRLGKSARRACTAALATNELAVSSIIFFEIGLLLKRGRLKPSLTVREWRAGVQSLGIRELPISAELAIRASELENLSGDPVDRFIVATALVERAVLLTADAPILSWAGPLQRQDAQR
jgi:PIN domain nuclease of toxin-antitoxin system